MIIEAMTMARPLIAPDHGGAVEMIENGKTGLLFKPGDAQDLAEKILTLYRDSALRNDMGRSARTHALQAFSIEEHVRHVEAVYKQLLKMS
jgi:glycosyltransferase involved in cell wall biosynthesis